MTTTLTPIEVRQAQPDDISAVMEILGEAAAWAATKGINLWSSPPTERWWQRMEQQLIDREVYLAFLNGEAVGTLRLTWSDRYWSDQEGNAGYVHSLAVCSGVRGQAVGSRLLDWVIDEIRRQGKQYVRLDCDANNGRLRHYYEEQGFRFCGQFQDRDYVAALYELKL